MTTEEMLQLILTEVKSIKESQEELKEGQKKLEEGQKKLEAEVAEIKQNQAKMQNQIDKNSKETQQMLVNAVNMMGREISAVKSATGRNTVDIEYLKENCVLKSAV